MENRQLKKKGNSFWHLLYGMHIMHAFWHAHAFLHCAACLCHGWTVLKGGCHAPKIHHVHRYGINLYYVHIMFTLNIHMMFTMFTIFTDLWLNIHKVYGINCVNRGNHHGSHQLAASLTGLQEKCWASRSCVGHPNAPWKWSGSDRMDSSPWYPLGHRRNNIVCLSHVFICICNFQCFSLLHLWFTYW